MPLKVSLLVIASVGIVVALTVYYRFLAATEWFPRIALAVEVGDKCSGNSGRWQNFSSDIFRLYAYSAFFDDRSSLLSSPVVRIIAISDPFEDLAKQKNAKLFCVLDYDSQVVVTRMKHNPMSVGFGWPLNRRSAKEYVYTCPTVNDRVPNSVALTTFQSSNVSSCVSVTVPRKPASVRDFCVCVQVSFGQLDPYRLIEWFELLKLLGVSLVGVYDLSISESGLKVLQYYVQEGLVDLRRTEAIHPNDYQHYLLQGSPVINDCIYRHMHEFRKIIVIDFDEVIIPHKHRNLSELMTYLDQLVSDGKVRFVNFAFRNSYFFLNLPPDEAVESNMTMLRYRKRVEISPEGYSVKSIINPQACTNMHNHYCWGVTAQYSKLGGTASVDPQIAVNQHYKKCHFSSTECATMMKNATQDDAILRFKDVLVERVGEKVKTIMSNDNHMNR